MEKMLSTREVKDILSERVGLDYTIQHITYLIARGYFPGSVKGPGRTSRWRIPESGLEYFIDSVKRESTKKLNKQRTP